MATTNIRVASLEKENAWFNIKADYVSVAGRLAKGGFLEFETSNGRIVLNTEYVIYAEAGPD